MRTIERNFKKHPHTARFLRTFHDANGANYGRADETEDLLDEVPVEAPKTDRRSPAQAALMNKLIGEITELDAGLGAEARAWTDGMTGAGEWTYGRDPRTGISRWIDALIAKNKELHAAAPVAAPTAPVEIPASIYGINHEGEVKCYALDYGKEGTRWAGFTFLNRVSSDNRFPIRNAGEKARILAAILEMGLEASEILAGVTLRRCRRCGRGLSDTKNPYFDVALGPDCGAM